MEMQRHSLVQGSPEWLAYRQHHYNASDAPAALNVSPHQTRAELIAALASGVRAEVSDYQQKRILDPGHEYEGRALTLAEELIGEELAPIVASLGKLSASYDGLTESERIAWEHKRLNSTLAAIMVEGCTGTDLPIYHQVQLEQQCAVCTTIERILFMASSWDKDGGLIEMRYVWYYPNPSLRARIIEAWDEVAAEVEAWAPAEVAPVQLVESAASVLPAVVTTVSGSLKVSSNIDEAFRLTKAFIERIPAKPSTSLEFGECERAVEKLEAGVAKTEADEAALLANMGDANYVISVLREMREVMNDARLSVEKVVKKRKAEVKEEIAYARRVKLAAYVKGLNDSLGAPVMDDLVTADFDAAVKGKRSPESMAEACDTLLQQTMLAGDKLAAKVRANLDVLAAQAEEHAPLFDRDHRGLIVKDTEDLRAIVTTRVAEYERQQEAKRAEKLADEKRTAQAVASMNRLDDILGDERAARGAAAAECEAVLSRLQAMTFTVEEFGEGGAERLTKALASSVASVESSLRDAQAREAAPAPTPAPAPAPVITQVAEPQAQAANLSPANSGDFFGVAEQAPSGVKVRLGDVLAHVGAGFTMTAAFVAELGVPTTKQGASVLLDKADLPLLRAKLIAHLQKLSLDVAAAPEAAKKRA